MHLLAGLAHFSLQGYRQLDAGCLGLKLQLNSPVKTPSVAIMALCRNVLQEDDILCEFYADTRSDISDCSDNESLDSDSDVPTTSSHKQLRSSAGPLTTQFPRPFLLTSIKIIFITV